MGTKNATFQQSLVDFTHRRIREFAGLGLWALAATIILSLVSYTPHDPSLNFAADVPVNNWMGYPGAVIADFLLQTLGLASGVICLALLAWGWRFMSKYQHRRVWLRISLLMLLLPTVALLMSFVSTPLSWPIETGLGGAIGALLRSHLLAVSSAMMIIVGCLLLVLFTLPVTLGLSKKEWKGLFFGTLWAGIYLRSVGRYILPMHKMGLKMPAIFSKALNFARNAVPEAKAAKAASKPRKQTAPSTAEPAAESSVSFSKPRINKQQPAETQSTLALQTVEGDYALPPMDLLKQAKKARKALLTDAALEQSARLLATVLQDFGVKGEITDIHPGPVVTLYELEPAAGTKSSRVIGLADDIARSMSAVSARISVIPGRNALGIELPNTKRETVLLRQLLEDGSFTDSNCKLPLALGKDIGGNPIVADLARMPHLLVAGTTGSGKSVSVNAMIASLLYHHSPQECKFIMIDPKMLELSVYDGIPHLLSPVVTEPAKAVVALKWVVKEMENRYRLMANLGVRNVEGYNKRIKLAREKGEELKRTVQTGFDPETGKPIYEEQALDMNPLPFIVVVVDEMADLMLVAGKDIEASIQRLAQMARAAGIHIIMATQRPSVDVITGVIKANFPTRISFQVTSRIDSRTILGEQGAEQLLGMGDMLYMAGGGRVTRIHGPFISDEEINKIVAYLKTQGEPQYVDDVTIEPEELDAFSEPEASDEEQRLYQKAVAIVRRDQKASTSYIQRCLKIGYNKAARLVEQMEREGIISPPTATGKREIIG